MVILPNQQSNNFFVKLLFNPKIWLSAYKIGSDIARLLAFIKIYFLRKLSYKLYHHNVNLISVYKQDQQSWISSIVWCSLPLSIIFTEWFDYFSWKWIFEIWISTTNNGYLVIFPPTFNSLIIKVWKIGRFLFLGFSCLWTWIKLDYSANSLSLFFLSLKHSVWLSFS